MVLRSHICYECGNRFDTDAPDWQTIRCKRCQKTTGRGELVIANEEFDERKKAGRSYLGSSQKWKKGQSSKRGKIDS